MTVEAECLMQVWVIRVQLTGRAPQGIVTGDSNEPWWSPILSDSPANLAALSGIPASHKRGSALSRCTTYAALLFWTFNLVLTGFKNSGLLLIGPLEPTYGTECRLSNPVSEPWR